MPGFDLTDIGNNAKGHVPQYTVRTPVPSHQDEDSDPILPQEPVNTSSMPDQVVVNGHVIKTRSNGVARNGLTSELNKENPQMVAGEVDAKQEEFLKTTKWVD